MATIGWIRVSLMEVYMQVKPRYRKPNALVSKHFFQTLMKSNPKTALCGKRLSLSCAQLSNLFLSKVKS
jgi:hypothetical protein